MVKAQRAIRTAPGIAQATLPRQRVADEYDLLVLDDGLRNATESLYRTQHYRQSILQAYIYVNNLVKARSKITQVDGHDLMNRAFSANNPKLAVNDLKSRSKRDEQQGYMEIFAGAMLGIRNPRAHENAWPDDRTNALELLAFAQHLVTKASTATVKRQKRKPRGSSKTSNPTS